ncbi:MAG: tryptophan synthase subunit alpha [Elusimicrobiota bacterium]
MKNLNNTVQELKQKKEVGLSFFLTGGYPTMQEFIEILKFIDKEKLADFAEIGIPFSDPLADGKVIQNTSKHALKKGASFEKISHEIKEINNDIEIPLVLMSYLNPLYAKGLEKSFEIIKKSGYSGVILPDLSIEESGEVTRIAEKFKIETIFLITPSTPLSRISSIADKSSPFVYYVSSFGVTGERENLDKGISKKIKAVKQNSSVPVYCGFGISKSHQAKIIAGQADGIIIGSALLKKISLDKNKSYFKDIKKFAISIRKEIKN